VLRRPAAGPASIPIESVYSGKMSKIAQSSVLECVKVVREQPLDKQQRDGRPITNASKHRILLVEDEPTVREVLASLLNEEGYDVSTAEHGFDALAQMQSVIPDVIISDLNMPLMSGFEFLSVVRRRFPDIPAIAVSGAYESGDHVPGGVIADAFFAKGRMRLKELLPKVAELIQTAAARAQDHHRQSAPVWIPRNGKDSKGVPFIVLTCTQCLRSFPLSVLREDVQEIQETPCLWCVTPVRYIIDFSLAVTSPKAHSASSRGQQPPAADRHYSGKMRKPMEEHNR
jgi:CheY-like chemotaxis protein